MNAAPGPRDDRFRQRPGRREVCRRLLAASGAMLLGRRRLRLRGVAGARRPAATPRCSCRSAARRARSVATWQRAAGLGSAAGGSTHASGLRHRATRSTGRASPPARRSTAAPALLLGPLRADQTPAVLAEAGAAPVVTFSNDDRLAAQGAFVMGVTPAQSVAAAFSYARAQGVRARRGRRGARAARRDLGRTRPARSPPPAASTLTVDPAPPRRGRRSPRNCARPAAASCRMRCSCRTAAPLSSTSPRRCPARECS